MCAAKKEIRSGNSRIRPLKKHPPLFVIKNEMESINFPPILDTMLWMLDQIRTHSANTSMMIYNRLKRKIKSSTGTTDDTLDPVERHESVDEKDNYNVIVVLNENCASEIKRSLKIISGLK
ncbi:hypothetical protein GJ496_004126 [Pomphorhynchus laevis]|nr:hypothetical protein GJ496_004126 [Pomphorhynchus laevis]